MSAAWARDVAPASISCSESAAFALQAEGDQRPGGPGSATRIPATAPSSNPLRCPPPAEAIAALLASSLTSTARPESAPQHPYQIPNGPIFPAAARSPSTAPSLLGAVEPIPASTSLRSDPGPRPQLIEWPLGPGAGQLYGPPNGLHPYLARQPPSITTGQAGSRSPLPPPLPPAAGDIRLPPLRLALRGLLSRGPPAAARGPVLPDSASSAFSAVVLRRGRWAQAPDPPGRPARPTGGQPFIDPGRPPTPL